MYVLFLERIKFHGFTEKNIFADLNFTDCLSHRAIDHTHHAIHSFYFEDGPKIRKNCFSRKKKDL